MGTDDGLLHVVKDGADSVLPFNKGIEQLPTLILSTVSGRSSVGSYESITISNGLSGLSGLYNTVEIRTMNRGYSGTLKVYLDGTLKATQTTPINYTSNPEYTKYTYDISGVDVVYFELSGRQNNIHSYYTRLEKTYFYS